MKQLLLVICLLSPVFAQQITPPPASNGGSAAIACVGTPGNTTGTYRQQCQTSAGAIYACNNAAGCTIAADWVTSGGSYTLPTASDAVKGGVTMSTATSSVATATDDARNTNARAPTTHASTHATGQTDALSGTLAVAISGNAATATALAANGANCSSGQAPLGVDASGAAEGCWTPQAALTGPMTQAVANSAANTVSVSVGTSGTAFAKTPVTIDPSTGAIAGGKIATAGAADTAAALAANGANCSANNFATGVDASGAAEGCAVPPGTYTLPAATASTAGGVTLTVAAQKFFGTAAPGSVTGNLPGDFFTDTTAHNQYVCNAPSGTGAPACTSVATAGWLLVNGGSAGKLSATFLLCAGGCYAGETTNWKWSAPFAVTFTGCVIDAVTYPTGAAVAVDLLKGGTTTIFSGAVPTLANGSSAYATDTGMAAGAAFSQGQYLIASVLTAGSTIAGQFVNVTCTATY